MAGQKQHWLVSEAALQNGRRRFAEWRGYLMLLLELQAFKRIETGTADDREHDLFRLLSKVRAYRASPADNNSRTLLPMN